MSEGRLAFNEEQDQIAELQSDSKEESNDLYSWLLVPSYMPSSFEQKIPLSKPLVTELTKCPDRAVTRKKTQVRTPSVEAFAVEQKNTPGTPNIKFPAAHMNTLPCPREVYSHLMDW